jgi:hypothetical protein
MKYLKEEQQNEQNSINEFNMIYGEEGISLNGPIFFFIIGISCVSGFFVLTLLTGTSDISIFGFQEIESLRPSIAFPFVGIIQIFLFVGASVGLIFGPIGILWYLVSE